VWREGFAPEGVKKTKGRKRIGFVSTRFAGTDGVSLESEKWAKVFSNMGHDVFWFAGELDREPGYLVPQAHFKHRSIKNLHDQAFNLLPPRPNLDDGIESYQEYLQGRLSHFVAKYDLDMIISQNTSAIPMNIPLGVAIARYIERTNMPAIFHHHDFFWERQRFLNSNVYQYLLEAFPPNLPSVQHVVLNTQQQTDLLSKTGNQSIVIPNVMPDEERYLVSKDEADKFKYDHGIADYDIVLQSTRVVKRKNIENAVRLVDELKKRNKKTLLYISHESGDEGHDYLQKVLNFATSKDVRVILEKTPLDIAYGIAAVVSYTSLIEGFGNVYTEAAYYGKPIVGFEHDVFVKDIKPKGFQIIPTDAHQISQKTVDDTIRVIEDGKYRRSMTDNNFEVAQRHFSLRNAKASLTQLLH